jgi:hypothetical protein
MLVKIKKSLFLKCKCLNEEYIELFDENSMYTKQIKEEANKIFEDNDIKPDYIYKTNQSKPEALNTQLEQLKKRKHENELEFDKNSEDDDVVKDIVDPFWTNGLKKLYRRILAKTHPDKYSKYMSKEERDHYIDIYNNTVDVKNTKSLYTLLNSATKLFMTFPNITLFQKQSIVNECDDLTVKISDIKHQIPYNWGICSDVAKKEQYIKDYIKIRYGIKM